jgi:hypothetical protein
MTLKERFQQWFINDVEEHYEGTVEEVAIEHEKVADEFAIGLLEFIEGTYSYSNIFDYWYLHADTSKTYTKKQLLEIYKKEKGL